jgi:DNA invertase Pin-like site-specific DNA recombinase
MFECRRIGRRSKNKFGNYGKSPNARGWQVIEEYRDAGISGAKGRDSRPGLDRMLKDASRRRFDVVMAWAIDRLGRSLIDLLGTIQTLEACGVDLYLDQQSIDTTTPTGRLIFQVTGAFAEFERSMIRQRVQAGLKRAVEQGKTLAPVRGRPSAANDRPRLRTAPCQVTGKEIFSPGRTTRTSRRWSSARPAL